MWTNPDRECCRTCGYWLRRTDHEGECLRYPVKPPTFDGSNWCGEYRNEETHTPSKITLPA